ncbi:MAG: hypothetical protein COY80_01500 [Candidatus Pacebacteria bacterium CG_4_10_14_0_8_um_filter_42_14]|nr:MAG: hypothetical protein COY80_01500 [Candidatus Pacebacteria bacterium CG_4_10_14_0_8_um_filter_42_14]
MKQTILSAKQSELLERLIIKYQRIVTSEQIYEVASVDWTQIQAKKQIASLVENGWLIRVKRGLFVISDLSNRGFLSLSPLVVAGLLNRDSYVSFETALSYHGMFDQLADKIISISKKRYKTTKVGNNEYVFVKTSEQFSFGWEEFSVDEELVRVATAEKALIDMVQFHKNKYSIDLVIEKIQEFQEMLDMEEFNNYLSKMSTTTIKIFGLIFDLLDIDSSHLQKKIINLKGTNWMIPGDRKFNAKWRLYYDEYFDKYKIGN